MTRVRVRAACPATKYAEDVLAGRIVAGPGMRGAAARHQKDLKRVGKADFPYVWDAERGDRVVRFFEDVLRLSIGETDGNPFVLLPWQHWYLRSMFSWVHKDTRLRRFRSAYLEQSKGNGKSCLHAGIGLYMLCADGERLPQVYVQARDREQAKVLFMFALEMVRQSPMLSDVIDVYGGNNPFNMTYRNVESGNWGFMRRSSTQKDAKGASGPIPSCALIDEIHELHSDAIVESMRKGAKTRKQPLLLLSTNSGESKTSVGWDYHETALRVACGDAEDDSLLAAVFNGDPDDAPLDDESVWAKTNPSLPGIPGMSYLRAEVATAKSMPSKRNLTLRLNFCEWTETLSSWIDGDMWEQCERARLDEGVLDGRSAVLAFDLSAKRDLTAGVIVWRGEDGELSARAQFWLPEEGLLERERMDSVPYGVWKDAGLLELTPGRVVDYEWPAKWLMENVERFDVRGVAFDRWKADEFLRILRSMDIDAHSGDEYGDSKGGVPVYMHAQGNWRKESTKRKDGELLTNGLIEPLWMPGSVNHLEEAILKGKLDVELNPCLRWNVLSAVTVEDASGNRRFEKRKSSGRIDGCVALAMAVGLANAMPTARRVRGPLVQVL